ncbi:MAG: hypothetical protein A2Y03_07420 [Omnitrophica WOR_2 bacterium GWF2_38_59]|nr:MAG: hypothetical protein A2Y06_03055 [Omnitrophica WOR_2 bacterium GWA2_37_7]OGX26023.1 MAG: hypothetical protein A2Y03_07420 [Omnitrophica WOR_2 bacterium GWF2_38_59]OGX48830.1 MAG: hypothetical protein A2243_09110 [Omnitrophica WOR_2 bacterium RIFOXYA2_FULL_38_17]OGX51882.1 MAG: hypothetical protein A2267_04815 [Omnitrophica WOR_2 bacterium RIFOXYA12_FULL_38_10]OGX56648.1 MAG: hypothetical protein A2306_04195 [Omnitrophica WOR_2 bacterium RIFOXYB2_FULL_38_16]OGX57584.1 MAG: hypothetical 
MVYNQPNNPSEGSFEERRRYKRINKNFILSYFIKNLPEKRFEITQLKNISLGGMCFITSQAFEPGTEMGIELKTPYMSDVTYLEGKILQSHVKVKNMIYETRFEFEHIQPQAEFLISKLIEFFIKEEKNRNA